jgi:hypothetical protein
MHCTYERINEEFYNGEEHRLKARKIVLSNVFESKIGSNKRLDKAE